MAMSLSVWLVLQAHIGVRKFMWPLLCADFELIETYRPPSLEPLDCDVTAIGARADGRYSPDQVPFQAGVSA